jgi:hypothetical protein
MLDQGATVSSINEGLLYYRRHRENFLKYEYLENEPLDEDIKVSLEEANLIEKVLID